MDKLFDYIDKLLGRNKKEAKPEQQEEEATVVHIQSAVDQSSSGNNEVARVKKGSLNKKAKKEVEPAQDDSVVSDINKFKKFSEKILGQTGKTIGPSLFKGAETLSDSFYNLKESLSFNFGFLKNIIQFLVVIVVIGGLVYAGFRLIISTRKRGEEQMVVVPTPTPATYSPYKPSIYADDETMIELEEDVNVLKREVSYTNIRETTLNPPSLDFDISF
jgi:hypothetical protein